MNLIRFALVVAVAVQGVAVGAQSLDNSYDANDAWARLPPGIQFGQITSIEPDRDGNLVVFHRSNPSLLVFSPDGQLVQSLNLEMIVKAHGLALDEDGNIWVTDADGRDGRGHQVFKLSRDGKVLLTLGTAGKFGESPDLFYGPTDVAIAKNGDIFVSDGHFTNGRIVKFSKDGTFIKAWGRHGSAPGEFAMPHCLAIDARGRVFVGDRENSRIQIFDQEGRLLDQWTQFGRPAAMFIDAGDTLYVSDTDSSEKVNPGFKRGIRIGNAATGQVTGFIPDTSADPDDVQYSGPDAVAADAAGNIYAGDLASHTMMKYVKQSSEEASP